RGGTRRLILVREARHVAAAVAPELRLDPVHGGTVAVRALAAVAEGGESLDGRLVALQVQARDELGNGIRSSSRVALRGCDGRHGEGGEDDDERIWGERGVTDGLGLGEAGLSDEGDIGPANGIGIRRELEATFDVDATEAPGSDVVRQASAKLQRNTTVAQTGWLADDEDAAHELGVLVGNLQQFIRGQDRGRHAENVGGLAGHGKPSWCESINGASTRSTATKVHWQTRSILSRHVPLREACVRP